MSKEHSEESDNAAPGRHRQIMATRVQVLALAIHTLMEMGERPESAELALPLAESMIRELGHMAHRKPASVTEIIDAMGRGNG